MQIIEVDKFVIDKSYDSNFIRNTLIKTLEKRNIKSTISS